MAKLLSALQNCQPARLFTGTFTLIILIIEEVNMRLFSPIFLVLGSICFFALLIVPDAAVQAVDDKPDLLIAFTGDLQGYLEECG